MADYLWRRFCLIVAFWKKLSWLKKFVFGGVSVWFIFYAIMLFGFSLLSEEKTLVLNEPKEFCGFYLDCHMHTAVTGVRKAKTIGDKKQMANFTLCKVKVFSDARQATLGLITVDAKVVDESKNEYKRDEEAEKQLGEQPPFDRRITPTESFEKEIVFDLPADVKNPRLDIREGFGIDHVIEAVLVDDEDSVLHKRKFYKFENKQVVQN